MKINSDLFLKSLRMQNFATFETQEIQFDPKFNAIIGETGSGKSLILDALEIVFGGRADKKLIRKNSEFATIEATFSSSDASIKAYFNEIGHPFERDEIVIKRIIYPTESAKSFLNFQSCSASVLASFSKRFIDIVGQFENQKLLSDDYQLVLLDSYAGLAADLKDYSILFSQLNSFKKDYQNLIEEKKLRSQREDYIRFQIDEIEKLGPSIEDENELVAKKERMLNFEKNREALTYLSSCISDNDNDNESSMLDIVKNCLHRLEKSNGILSGDVTSKLFEVKALLEDVSYEISKGLSVQNDEGDLESIIDRLDCYQKLKRKFGGNTENTIEALSDFKHELNSYTQVDDKIEFISKKIGELENKCLKFADELHIVRQNKALSLSAELTNKVRDLKMLGSTMKIEVVKNEQLSLKGSSRIEFIAETNTGEGFHKVKEIASGGELSRILLAMRQILSSSDSISIFLFDEIDAGIGGETALCIGKALQNVSHNSQVLAITHLPQIATYSSQIINVEKSTFKIDEQIRTVSTVCLATGDSRELLIKQMNPIA